MIDDDDGGGAEDIDWVAVIDGDGIVVIFGGGIGMTVMVT